MVVVFIELLLEAQHKHATDSIILDLETWGNLIAQTFRMLSRKKLQTYKNTLATLKNTQRSRSNSDFIVKCTASFHPS